MENKNTLWGMLMIAGIVMLFMYLQRPSAEEIKARQELAQQQAEAAAKSDANTADVLTPDSVSPDEERVICSTVKEYGTPDTVEGKTVYNLATGSVNLFYTPDDNALSGVVTVDGTAVSMSAILSHNYGNIKPSTAAAAVKSLKETLADMARFKGFARYLSGHESKIKLHNEVLELEVSTKGGIISRAKLLDPRYTSFDSTQVCLMAPEYGSYSFTLTTESQRLETRNFYFVPQEVTDSTVLMQLDLGDGVTWGLRYRLEGGDSYVVHMDVVQQGMAKAGIIPANVSSMGFEWTQKMPRNEAGRMFEERNSAIYYQYAGGGVKHLSENGTDDEDLNEPLRWIGYKNQFFSAVLIAVNNFEGAKMQSAELKDDFNYLKNLSTEATVSYSTADAQPASFIFYFGPNLYPLLDDIEHDLVGDADLQLTKLIPLGWSLFRWISTLIIIPLFTFLGKFISSYGIIILLLTIFIKIILFPFTYKSYMSQARMRVLAPEIKAINEKYPDKADAMKRQQETMALYSRAGANPMSGCLPMLLQMPILIAMFNFFPSAIELRGQSFLWAKDLSAPDALIPLPFNVPLLGDHLSIFCLLMTATNILYSWYNMQSQPSSGMPSMKWMMILMPLFFLVFFNNYASGLSYYYFLSLLITIIQMWIFRKVVNEDKVRTKMAENAKKPKKKSGFAARLEAMQKENERRMRELNRQRGKR